MEQNSMTTERGHDNPNLVVDDDSGKLPELQKGPEVALDLKSESHHHLTVEFEDLPADLESGFACRWFQFLPRCQDWLRQMKLKHAVAYRYAIFSILGLAYNVYFGYAVYVFYASGSSDYQWCDGFGFLVILTVLLYWALLSRFALSMVGNILTKQVPLMKLVNLWNTMLEHRYANAVLYCATLIGFLIFILVDTADDPRRLMSAFGIVILVAIGALFSAHPARIRWRHVVWGLALQYLFGLAILRWSVGESIFSCLASKVTEFLGYTRAGSDFVFGYLSSQTPFREMSVPNSSLTFTVIKDINHFQSINGVFLFKVLSVIYFFSFIISMLFYLGAMQWLIAKIGWILQITVGTTACESLTTAANIFIGQTEAPLIIKPIMSKMTNSELHVVMTGGFATVAGGAMAAYISFNVSALHLMSASVMSAPAALAMSKLLMPETKVSKTSATMTIPRGEEANLIDAASQGAITAVFIVANIAGSLVAVLAFISFINGMLGWAGQLIGVQKLTFQYLLGKMFVPLSGIMGVESADLEAVGTLIGIKSFINEFAAYDMLNTMDTAISKRSRVIATYALCGFSNPASIGIQIAGLGTLAPDRRADFARLAFRAYVAGSMACFLTACVAGTLL